MRGKPRISRRREPYTEIGIKRVRCARCGARCPSQQWQICADGNTWRALCLACDYALNKLVLEFMDFPDKGWKLSVYAERLKLKYGFTLSGGNDVQ